MAQENWHFAIFSDCSSLSVLARVGFGCPSLVFQLLSRSLRNSPSSHAVQVVFHQVSNFQQWNRIVTLFCHIVAFSKILKSFNQATPHMISFSEIFFCSATFPFDHCAISPFWFISKLMHTIGPVWARRLHCDIKTHNVTNLRLSLSLSLAYWKSLISQRQSPSLGWPVISFLAVTI